jgi:hypothetical protein
MTDMVRINRNLTVEKSFYDFLSMNHNIICLILLNINTEPGIDFLAPTDKADLISYLPENKLKDGELDPFTAKGRAQMKIGRLVQKLIPDKLILEHNIDSRAIENFVNKYKAWFDTSELEFRIVEGEEIKKWYLDENYFAPDGNYIGTLWNSCMRYAKRQSYLQMYSNNPIKMLCLITKQNGEEKVRSRALLWDDVSVISSDERFQSKGLSNIKVMDRIYSVFDSDVHLFKKWAKENGYVTKWEQSAKSHQFFDVDNERTVIKCKIKLQQYNFNYYPYLDTFPYFDLNKGFLRNDINSPNYQFTLVQANGSLESVEDNESVEEDNW